MLLRGPAESLRVLDWDVMSFFARADVLFGRSQILEELTDPRRTHALLEDRKHFDGALNASCQRRDHFSGMHLT